MMESIKELRKICQSTAKVDGPNVYMRYVVRFFSIYGTRLLLPTQITANQVSFAMIVTGIIATLFFLHPSKGFFLCGALLLQIWYLIDCMDGEVARYRNYEASKTVIKDKRSSGMTGTYYDIINHYIINLLVPATLGYGIYQIEGNSVYMLIGIVGALGQVLMLAKFDGLHRVTLSHIRRYAAIEIKKEDPISVNAATKSKKRSYAHWGFMVLQYTLTYPTVMNLTLIAALFNFFSSTDARPALLIYLTAGSLIVVSLIIRHHIASRILENNFLNEFTVHEKAPLWNPDPDTVVHEVIHSSGESTLKPE